MARYLILDGDGADVIGWPFASMGAAIHHARLLLSEETLRRRKPESFLTEDNRAALVGLYDGSLFVPHYFIQGVNHELS